MNCILIYLQETNEKQNFKNNPICNNAQNKKTSHKILRNNTNKRCPESLQWKLWDIIERIKEKIKIKETYAGTSVVVQWLRICLPMQGARVRALVREDPTCRRAAKSVSQNYWAHVPQLLSPRTWSPCSPTGEPTAMRSPHTTMKSGPRSPQLEKAHVQQQRPNATKNK